MSSFHALDIRTLASPYLAPSSPQVFGNGLSVPGAGTNSEMFGASAAAGGNDSLAVGNGASAGNLGSTAVGRSAGAGGSGATAVGAFSSANIGNATAVGYFASASVAQSVAVGRGATSGGLESIAMGYLANVTGWQAIGIGRGATVSANDATVVGNLASSAFIESIAIGSGASAPGANRGVWGSSAKPVSLELFSNILAIPQGQGSANGWVLRDTANTNNVAEIYENVAGRGALRLTNAGSTGVQLVAVGACSFSSLVTKVNIGGSASSGPRLDITHTSNTEGGMQLASTASAPTTFNALITRASAVGTPTETTANLRVIDHANNFPFVVGNATGDRQIVAMPSGILALGYAFGSTPSSTFGFGAGGVLIGGPVELRGDTYPIHNLVVYYGGTNPNNAAIKNDQSLGQFLFTVGSTYGRQWVFTERGNVARDHDHTTEDDPRIYLHSATSPDTANDEWIGFKHDKTDGIIDTGSGNLKVVPASGLLEIGGLLISGYTSSTADPTTTELPNDKQCGFHKNTTSGDLFLAFNDGGSTIKKILLT